MRRTGSVLLVMTGAIALGAGAGAPLARPAAGRCDGLAGRTLVARGQLRITERVTKDATGRVVRRYAGCLRPAGRVYPLGYSSPEATARLDPGSFSVSKTAGRFVLFRQFVDGGSGAGEQVDTRVVIDLRSGARRELWRLVLAEGDCVDEQPLPAYPGPPKQLALSPSGVAAGVFVPTGEHLACFTPRDMTVVRASAPGVRSPRELDRAPIAQIRATSLRVRGRTVSWTRSGSRHSATLPGRG